MLYADDLVIFSESQEGLQNSMNRLSDYCDTWGLEVSHTKSNFMCVGQLPQNEAGNVVRYKEKQLEQVSSYRYLGVLFDDKGNVMTGKNDIYKRGLIKGVLQTTQRFESPPQGCNLPSSF